MTIAFGIRLRGDIGFNDFWLSFAGMEKQQKYDIIAKRGYNPGEAARSIFRDFLKTEDTHVLMLDDDATLAPQTLVRLMSRDLPVVGALSWTRGLPPTPTIWRGASGIAGKYVTWRTRIDDVTKWLERPEVGGEIRSKIGTSEFVLDYNPKDALSRTDNIGFHCVLIRRDVIEAVGEPFCQENESGVHEDFDFSSRAICAGFDLFIDKTVFAGHISTRASGPMDFWAWMNALQLDAQQLDELEAKRAK